ncbi:MAG: hypothetical protein A2W91_03750 [Bacteroidetes bacterium GWF2_38_335]|nr:MAG: hypothetical protein A2W91_03750 [Bacteroidetes bacterium GWF2_38_335]OFY77621.1 MAG: hypothetical protein A2281_01010 [Bacteroidetes bacterium RIFOXYA12_FULL_38_20]
MAKALFILSVVLLILTSCQEEKNKNKDLMTETEKKETKETIIQTNKHLVKEYAQKIKAYSKRRGWNLTESETGLFYEIIKKGDGIKAEAGMVITLNYKLSLLDGQLCYSSDSLGPKKFKIGMGGVEPGLEEGVLLLKEGDKARFIMPPYMAWGVLGDDKKIPPFSIIVYYVEVLKLSDAF